ncbi:hypothetical protein, partial [Vibrio cholerae]|uniref:hypothetical protein n=1 Tax=Vibrio cholerae TaxID=666 RepID=UPI0022701C5D
TGFKERWNKRLNRYQEIYKKNKKLIRISLQERLKYFFNELARYQFVIKIQHDDEIEFDDSESHKIQTLGFIGIHKDEFYKINRDQEELLITYYIGQCGVKAETMLIYHLQNCGFNIVLGAQRSQCRLAHNTFSFLQIEPFYHKLSFTEGESENVTA